MIDAIIFDFDGLIIDTEIADYLSWQKMYAEFGVELALDVWHANIGTANGFNPYLHLEGLLGSPIDRQAVHTRRKQWDNELIAQQKILPGVETVRVTRAMVRHPDGAENRPGFQFRPWLGGWFLG